MCTSLSSSFWLWSSAAACLSNYCVPCFAPKPPLPTPGLEDACSNHACRPGCGGRPTVRSSPVAVSIQERECWSMLNEEYIQDKGLNSQISPAADAAGWRSPEGGERARGKFPSIRFYRGCVMVDGMRTLWFRFLPLPNSDMTHTHTQKKKIGGKLTRPPAVVVVERKGGIELARLNFRKKENNKLKKKKLMSRRERASNEHLCAGTFFLWEGRATACYAKRRPFFFFFFFFLSLSLPLSLLSPGQPLSS